MACLSKPYHINFFKGCLSQILLGPFLNALTQMWFSCQPNQLTTNPPHHIETSQLICSANQLTGVCMVGNSSR